MSDSLLIFVPLVVFAVVLLLGFAGCDFHPGTAQGPESLRFRASVPSDLTVDGGVTFSWTTPTSVTDAVTVTFAQGPSLDRYITAALDLSPALLWTLGDVDGLVDRTGKGRDGQPLGGVAVGGQPDGPTVFDATATHFDGVDDGITASSYSPFMGNAGRTFVGWTRRDSNTTTDLLFGSTTAAAANQARLFLPANEDVGFEPNGGGGQSVVWNNAWPGNAQWVWWALRFDQGAAAVSLFINGNLVSTQSCTDTWPTLAAGNFQVGVAGTTSRPLGGDSALIVVYEDLLSDASLTGLYQVSQDMGDDVYEHELSWPGAGTWFARCGMTVRRHGQVASYETADFSFVTQQGKYELTFQAVGAPGGPTPFAIVEPPMYVQV